MVEYQVKVGKEAKQSLRDFYTWLKKNESESLAIKVIEGIIESIASLSIRPERYGLLLEMPGSEIEYRKILKWSYKIIFVIEEELKEVFVVDVIHASRNPKYIQKKLGK